jgi:hypothetical protein
VARRPFPYLVGDHDVYFMDDMTPVGDSCCVCNWILIVGSNLLGWNRGL